MKVKALIKKLNKLNPDAEIIISSDSEGNSFSKLTGVGEPCLYHREKDSEYDYNLEIQLFELDDDDIPKGAKPAIVLWP